MASTSKRSWRLQDFVAHGANVNCLSLGHKSGRVLVTGGDDKKVNLWAVGKPNCIMSLTGHTTPVECVRFSHTEELVCAGSQAGALKIWDLEAAKIVRTLTGHKANIRCVDFHPYGDFLSSGSLDTNIKLWDIRRKGCIFTYKGHSLTVNSLKFSPDGQWIASAGEDGLVKLWDIRAGRMLSEFRDHIGPVMDVEFHPHEFLLASCSMDRKVNFWDLENFQRVCTTDGDSGPIRCIHFSPGGECLYSGSQNVLKIYGWEPFRTHDTIPVDWGRIQNIATAQNQLIGASFHMTNVMLFVVDLKRVQPFIGYPMQDVGHFESGHSMRKSFTKGKPPNGTKPGLDVKTIEESDRSGTDPEDESQSVADIKNVSDYRAIFQPNRALNRTPPPSHPFLAPPEKDPLVRQVIQTSAESVNIEEEVVRQEDYAAPSAVDSPKEELSKPVTSSPRQRDRRENARHGCVKESAYSFPETDYPVKLSNIRHSPSEPALNRPNLTHTRSSSLSRNFETRTDISISSKEDVTESYSRSLEKTSTIKTEKSISDISVPMDTSECPVRIAKAEKEDFVPMVSDKPTGLDLEEFLPKSYQRTYGYQQTFSEMSESEVFSSIMRGHDSVMAVLSNRQRSLQIINALWHSKDVKAAVDSAISMNDDAVIVDLLGVLTLRPSIWNLDICVSLLPCIHNLLQSKYEMYMTVGCNSLRLILRNFAPVIKTNIAAPIQTVGVDISREERYNKCIKCYNHLLSIRAFLLKRQTMQGKLGHTFRELHILMQSLDSSN